MNHEPSCLVGRTVVRIEGLEKGSESATFHCSDGATWTMYHSSDCCESVEIEDVCGDADSLVGSPMLKAEETTGEPPPHDTSESESWTFLHFATVKGYVTVRWWGQSNGYYGETPCYSFTEAK